MKIQTVTAILAFCVLFGGAISPLRAQTGNSTQGDAATQDNSSTGQEPQSSNPNGEPTPYTPGAAYNGMLPGNSVIVTNPQGLVAPNPDENIRSGVGRLDDEEVLRTPTHRYDLIYGLSASAIYQDHIPTGNGTTSNVGALATPHVSLIRYTRTGSYNINYSSTIMPYQSIGTSTAAFHNLSLTGNGMFSRRWQWSVSLSSEYGNEAARIAGPLSFELAGGFPIADAGFAVLTPFNENTVAGVASATLTWLPTQRDSISVSTMSGYTNILSVYGEPRVDTIPSESVGFQVSYNHNLSRKVSINEYGNFIRYVGPLDPFSTTHCNVYGGGVGLNVNPNRSVSLSVGGGPQVSDRGCGGSQRAGSGWVLLMGHPGPHTRIYAEGTQEYTTVYGLSGHWADTALAGASHDFRSLEVSLDGAAVQGQVSTLGGFTTVRGFFAGPELRYGFLRSLSMMAGYRIFRGSSTPYGSGSMNFVTAGLEWTPGAFGFPR